MSALINCTDLISPSSLTVISYGETLAAILCVALGIPFLVLNLLIFRYYQQLYDHTRVRVFSFLQYHFWGDVLLILGWNLPIAMGINNLPCWISFACFLCMGCFACANITRNTYFMLVTALSVSTKRNGRISFEKISLEEERLSSLSFVQRSREQMSLALYAMKFIFQPNTVYITRTNEDQLRLLVCLRLITKFPTSFLFPAPLLCLYCIVTISLVLTIPVLSNCWGCPPDIPIEVYTGTAFGASLLLYSVVFTLQGIDKLPDPWGFFKEELIGTIWVGSAFIFFLVQGYGSVAQRYYLNIGITVSMCIQFFCLSTLQVFIGKRHSQRVYTEQHPKSKGTVGSTVEPSTIVEEDNPIYEFRAYVPKLNHIFNNPELLKEFEQFLLDEFASENLTFLQDVYLWKSSYSDISPSANQVRIRKLINTYVIEGGLLQVNISYDQAKRVKEAASKGERTLFDEARLEVCKILELGPIFRFNAAHGAFSMSKKSSKQEVYQPSKASTLAFVEESSPIV